MDGHGITSTARTYRLLGPRLDGQASDALDATVDVGAAANVRAVGSPQTLSVHERRIVASWAADCAERVLAIFEDAMPDDDRVRVAIEQTRSFAADELDVRVAVRQRGGEAGAAAREAPTPAARAAAYAAEQAAAVAHMGAHALGAAGYAAKAWTLAAGRDDDVVAQSDARRQVAAMSDAVACALRSLPALGENRSGPLGPGRLSGGHVGAAIRAIQALLRGCHGCSEGPRSEPAVARSDDVP